MFVCGPSSSVFCTTSMCHTYINRTAHPATILLLIFLGGCESGPELAEVTGVVVFADGEKLTTGHVEFETIGQQKPISSTGAIKEDGTFVLGTYAADDGVMPGRYRAVVISDFQIGTGNERPGLIPEPQVDPRFRDFKTSGLEFEVSPGENRFEISVERARAKGNSQ